MSNQLYRPHLSIASPSEIEQTARQLRVIREDFLTTGNLALQIPRSMILKSWQRCYAMQVNPARRIAPLAVAREAQLSHLQEKYELLRRAARAVLGYLADFLADSGYVVVLSDANGCLLDVIGDVGIRRRLARIDFVPGGDWSEGAAGTNAIGTALADGHMVQLLAAEHYCDGWQDLTCTASPIRHPFTGEIIGVLDITGDYRLIRPFLTNSLATAAVEIQQELRLLLTSSPARAYQKNLQPIVAHSSDHTPSFLEIAMNNKYSQDADAKTSHVQEYDALGDDVQSHLNTQQRRVHDAERLVMAAGTISASLDLDITLKKVAEQAAYLLRLESATVFLFDDTGDLVSLHNWPEQSPFWSESMGELLKELFEQAEATLLVQERGEPVFVEDILISDILPVALVNLMGVRSLAMLPLVSARGVIGFIAAPKSITYQWTVDDVRLSQALAAQSASAIENAKMYHTLQQHNRRIEVVSTMAQLLNMLPDPNNHLDLILKRITEIMDLQAGMILLLDENRGCLNLVAHCGLSGEIALDLYEYPLKTLYEVACLVVAARESLLLCCVESNGHALHKPLIALGFCDVMAVPLIANNTIMGVLLIGSHDHRELTDEDLALFTAIGQQLGLTLKNTQLLRSESEMKVLREADQLKSNFIAAVSHDLRSPLTAIRASVESLLDCEGFWPVREHEHVLHNIAGQASRLGRLVDQLLDLSRIEAGALPLDREWTDLSVLIADTLTRFETLNRGCKVERVLAPNLPLHYVDPDRFVQVLWNLLENAHKYSSLYASIEVEAHAVGNEVVLIVADQGPGIPAGEREKIFQHFYRLDRDQRTHTQGSGLGLAICRGIVEAHGGRVWVEDRQGGGSNFYVALPLVSEPLDLDLEVFEIADLYAASTKET